VLRFITTCAVEELMEQRCREKLEMEKKLIGSGNFGGSLESKKENNEVAKVTQLDFLKQMIVKQREEDKMYVQRDDEGNVIEHKYDNAQHTSMYEATGIDALNKMLSRNEEERKLYESMDAQKFFVKDVSAMSDDKLKNNDALMKVGRLMQVREVPAGFQIEPDSDEESD